MSASARADIFARLSHAGAQVSAAEIERERESLGPAPRPDLPTEEPCEAFLRRVIANRGTVACAADRSAAVKAVGDYLYEHFRTHRLVAGNDSRLAAMPWRDAGVLPRFGTAESGEPVALSFGHVGVAELGGVVTFTGKGNPAANNLLPEHHIVLVAAGDIVATAEDAWQRIRVAVEKEGPPRGINVIAGPSSTADIEGQLVYGAHGPRAWHVIVLGELPPGALDVAAESAGS